MTQEKDEGYRSFSLFFAELSGGEANKVMTEELTALAKALSERAYDDRKQVKGRLDLKLSFTCNEKGVVGCSFDVKRTDPVKPKSVADIYWLTKDDKLTARNPKQQSLPLHEVPPRDRVVDVTGDAAPALEV